MTFLETFDSESTLSADKAYRELGARKGVSALESRRQVNIVPIHDCTKANWDIQLIQYKPPMEDGALGRKMRLIVPAILPPLATVCLVLSFREAFILGTVEFLWDSCLVTF